MFSKWKSESVDEVINGPIILYIFIKCINFPLLQYEFGCVNDALRGGRLIIDTFAPNNDLRQNGREAVLWGGLLRMNNASLEITMARR